MSTHTSNGETRRLVRLYDIPTHVESNQLTSIVSQARRIVQRTLSPAVEERPQPHLHVVERQTVAHAQNGVHRALGNTRLIRILAGRPQPALVVEETIAVGQRQLANSRLADDHRRDHRHRQFAAGLAECRLLARLRIDARIVYHDRCAVVGFRVGGVRVGRHANECIEADIRTGAGHTINGIVQLDVDVLVLSVAVSTIESKRANLYILLFTQVWTHRNTS